MIQIYGRVLLSNPTNIERKAISTIENYQIEKELRKGLFYEIVGLKEFQVKPYFDLDPRGDFDYNIFDDFEADLKNIIDVPIFKSGRKPRTDNNIIKHSRRYYLKARISYYNVPIVFKNIFDKYPNLIDTGVYSTNRKLFLPLSNMKFEKKVPQLKIISGDIFDNCASYIQEDYPDLDKLVPKISDVDKLLIRLDEDIKDEEDENDSDKYLKLKKIINLLKEKRSNDYDTWSKVCWAISNICSKESINDNKRDRLIHAFSKLSKTNYNEDKVDDFISKLKQREIAYGWNYLYQVCLKEDAPEYYNRLTQSYYNLKKDWELEHCKIIYPPQIISKLKNGQFQIQKIENAIKSHYHIQCYKKEQDKKGNDKIVKKHFILEWLADPHIRVYEENVFKPPPMVVKSHEHNCWIPFKISTEPLIITERDFFKEWCDFGLNLIGNQQYFNVILARYAQRIQTPAKRTNICVVYYGEERIGKNRFIEVIKKIMEDYYEDLDCAKKLYEKHSMYEFKKLFLCINEVQGIDNFQNADILKTRITENTIPVNPKGIQPYKIDNMCDYDMTTNNKNVIKITDKSHSRFFQVECTEYYKGNADFFNDYMENIENNPIAIRQIYEGLMKFDVKSVIPSGNFQIDKPTTDIEMEIRGYNKDVITLFLEDFTRDYMANKFGIFTTLRYSNQKFFDIWCEWLKKCRITNMDTLTKDKFGRRIAEYSKKQLEEGAIIKDVNNSITKINMEKLSKHFKMENIEVFMED